MEVVIQLSYFTYKKNKYNQLPVFDENIDEINRGNVGVPSMWEPETRFVFLFYS